MVLLHVLTLSLLLSCVEVLRLHHGHLLVLHRHLHLHRHVLLLLRRRRWLLLSPGRWSKGMRGKGMRDMGRVLSSLLLLHTTSLSNPCHRKGSSGTSFSGSFFCCTIFCCTF